MTCLKIAFNTHAQNFCLQIERLKSFATMHA
ncbi:hypothetical protein SNOG_13002 [Parastagonospora nodorum SN15]|uniref:Uncharacterized protein n=1 Tax=Phaeosphaeria nodorum (strain SN15 / ATCC MYA-4574 / FGSC 10173) TaxID=321614 RepID=Q0U5G2_PHANO|nr:hypothetical protein SNOG_13002 [Parastagonospora nodorum SN15]EAT79802.1 hypothetical protein SNOG_13002 [Parastagonospora nodorum SN15]